MEMLSPYIASGLMNGEKCFCAQKPVTLKRLVYDLRFIGIDVEREIARGALELHSEDEAYFPNKHFEPAGMMEMLKQAMGKALESGFSALRTAGEMSWAAKGHDQCDQILAYEKSVEEYFPGKKVIGLCQYDVKEFSPDVLECVLQHHRMHLDEVKGESLHSSLHVRYGRYNAEVVVDRFVVDPRYYYVVEQPRRSEIVGWGVAPDFARATAEAERLARSSPSAMA
jgi:hypothetical protein